MKKRAALILFGAVTGILPAPDAVASPGDTMRGVGLIDTWSLNCAVPPGTLGASRVRYEAPAGGSAIYSATSTIPIDTKPEAISVFEIEEAAILANNQIKLVASTQKESAPIVRLPRR